MPPQRSSRSGLWINDTLTPGIQQLPVEISKAVAAVVEYHAPQVENFMKVNAPWTDRTTNARNGLRATPVHGIDRHAIVAYHTMDYGFWLSVKNAGKFDIILPTIQIQGRAVMLTLRGLLGRMRGGRR